MKNKKIYESQRKYFKSKMRNLPVRIELYDKLRNIANFANISINDVLAKMLERPFTLAIENEQN